MEQKPSVMSIPSDDEFQAVHSSDLVKSAWILLEASVKHYRMGFNILTDSNLPAAQPEPRMKPLSPSPILLC